MAAAPGRVPWIGNVAAAAFMSVAAAAAAAGSANRNTALIMAPSSVACRAEANPSTNPCRPAASESDSGPSCCSALGALSTK
jgi:hypothetical protein